MLGRKWQEEIFPNDPGSDHYEIRHRKHVMTITPWWANCGAMGERIDCSCGFYTGCQFNSGCWQQGHDEKYDHEFDEVHERMYEYAMTL